MAKGSNNERELCRKFSLWWTGGKRDDVFYRTSGSGARARVRSNAGKDVRFGRGDMGAEDPDGQPLIDLCTFEFKRGYTALSLLDCIASKQKCPLLIGFLMEAETDAEEVPNYPVLVFQKDYKKAVICFPVPLFHELKQWFGLPKAYHLRLTDYRVHDYYVLMALVDFFKWAQPAFFENTSTREY